MQLKERLMKHRAAMMSSAIVLMAICISGCFSQQKHSSTAEQAGGGLAQMFSSSWSGSQKVNIIDPAYGMTAFTLNVPRGWKSVGTILRPGGCHGSSTPAAGLSYTELAPDGVSAFINLPGVSWIGSSNGYNFQGPKCPANINIDTAAGFLLNIAVPHLAPRAKSVTIAPLDPKFLTALASNSQQQTAKMRSYGIQGRSIMEAARVRVVDQHNGKPIEEMLFAIINCQQTQATSPKGPYNRLICNTTGTFIIRAPMGHLDEMIAHKPEPPQINNQWNNRVINDMTTRFQQIEAASDHQFEVMTQHYAQLNQDMLARGQRENDQRAAGTASAMQNDTNNQNAIDNSAHQTALYSLDQQTFINPDTGQKIEASNQFNNQWISSDGGTLIQTQDNSFDPNGSVYPISQSWTELIPAN